MSEEFVGVLLVHKVSKSVVHEVSIWTAPIWTAPKFWILKSLIILIMLGRSKVVEVRNYKSALI